MYNEVPVVVGIAGKAGTGKTTIAHTISPPANLSLDINDGREILWDHMFFAMPLYALVGVKDKTEGPNSLNRIAHTVHQQLYDLFRCSDLPSYPELVQLVERIVEYPLPQSDVKPRSFLQDVGTWCRELQDNCFTEYMRYRILDIHRGFLADIKRNQERSFIEELTSLPEHTPTYVMMVSDVRYPNEADVVRTFENGIVIQLECDDEERLRRLAHRDGGLMTTDQSNHSSEHSLEDISPDFVLDTTKLTKVEQAQAVKDMVKQYLEGK